MWSGLCLKFNAPWPLHLLFSQSTQQIYNSLFRFIFPIRRTAQELDALWILTCPFLNKSHRLRNPQKKSRKTTSQIDSVSLNKRNKGGEEVEEGEVDLKEMFVLRNRMSFVVNNLLAYLQVDVMEVRWKELVNAVKESNDFEQVKIVHDAFLQGVVSQCFLAMGKVVRAVQHLIHICIRFCFLVRRVEADSLDSQFGVKKWSPDIRIEFLKIKEEFENQSVFIFKILSSFKKSKSSQYLTQLLLRIDYNGYFSNLSQKLDQQKRQNYIS